MDQLSNHLKLPNTGNNGVTGIDGLMIKRQGRKGLIGCKPIFAKPILGQAKIWVHQY